jgi:hypothetical protein
VRNAIYFDSRRVECGDGKRFVVRADEKVTAFLELESALGVSAVKACKK